jgi:hypothetical protein
MKAIGVVTPTADGRRDHPSLPIHSRSFGGRFLPDLRGRLHKKLESRFNSAEGSCGNRLIDISIDDFAAIFEITDRTAAEACCPHRANQRREEPRSWQAEATSASARKAIGGRFLLNSSRREEEIDSLPVDFPANRQASPR